MYSAEEMNRKGLFNIIKLICFFIIVTIILIFIQKDKKTASLSCKLVADKDPVDGVYREPITVSIEASSKRNVEIKNIGIYQNARRNKEKYVLSSNGPVTLVGYVEDEDGTSATCIGTFELELDIPSCELEVTSGTLGLNDWYTSDVSVSFGKMSSNNDNVSISRYSIVKSMKDINTNNELSRADTNNNKLTITDNGNFEIIGKVEDEKGNVGECKLDVSIDKEKPVCELEIISTEDNIVPVIGFKDATDMVSDIYEKGIGTEKTYKEDTYSVTSYGTYKVYGYVEDNAGNENTCEYEVTNINKDMDIIEERSNKNIDSNIRNRVKEFFDK